jgi:predicted amidohydrolase
LATLDRKHFTAGNNLEVFKAEELKFGLQLCRDNAFPEQWKILKKKGAQLVFHINNAIKKSDINRKHVLISRAFENQYFVISVNNCAKSQTLPSLAISPFGEIIFESKPQKESVKVIDIDLSEVKSDYLEQERTDLVEVVYKG